METAKVVALPKMSFGSAFDRSRRERQLHRRDKSVFGSRLEVVFQQRIGSDADTLEHGPFFERLKIELATAATIRPASCQKPAL